MVGRNLEFLCCAKFFVLWTVWSQVADLRVPRGGEQVQNLLQTIQTWSIICVRVNKIKLESREKERNSFHLIALSRYNLDLEQYHK
jgi:hypothetical protein